MPGKGAGFQDVGIRHVDKSLRHGRVLSVFTLWLAANLTIADYALGSLFYGLPFQWVIASIVVGNIAGGALLGLMAAMGPTFGYPQMMISRAVFGRRGNLPFAVANWISTVGWFTVNVILSSFALKAIIGIPIYEGAAILVVVQVVLAIYGHDIIHGFERAMSVVLGIMFLAVAVIAYTGLVSKFPHYQSISSFNPYSFALAVATVFSYLMSWSPYASDYSRYLPEETSKLKLTLAAMAGGAIASAWLEVVGTMVYIYVGNPSADSISALATAMGSYSVLGLSAIALGAVAANALNLYTNSLSGQVVYERANRRVLVLIAGIVGYLLSLVGSGNFSGFYTDFLLTLDYWITPWIGVTLASFYITKTAKEVEGKSRVLWRALISYLIGLLASVPFMNLTPYGLPYEGPVSSYLQGVDVSYFISFAIALVSYLSLTRGEKVRSVQAYIRK